MELNKKTIAIICLTIITIALIWKGFPKDFIWSVITLIAFAAGIQAGAAYTKAKPTASKRGIPTIKVPFYYRKLISSICYLAGVFLLAEHLWTHGTTWDWAFPPGHELYAIILIAVGVLVGLRRQK